MSVTPIYSCISEKKKVQEKWSKPGLYLMSKDELLRFSKFSNEGFKSYQLTSACRSAHGWQIGQHWLTGNSHFPCGRIFIFYFSEPLGINSEVLNSLLLGKGLFI